MPRASSSLDRPIGDEEHIEVAHPQRAAGEEVIEQGQSAAAADVQAREAVTIL